MEDKETLVSEEAVENIEVPEASEEVAKETKSDKKKSKKLESEISELKAKLEAKEKELSEQNDKYMRMYAEYDNFRKRSAKERDGIYADAYADAISSILPILDNIERAAAFTDAEAVLKGVQMILRQSYLWISFQ